MGGYPGTEGLATMIDYFALAFVLMVLLAVPAVTLGYLYGCRVGRLREQAKERLHNAECSYCGWTSPRFQDRVVVEELLDRHLMDCVMLPKERPVRRKPRVGRLKTVTPAEQDAVMRRRRARA